MNVLKRMASIAIVAIMVLQVAVFAAPVPEDVIGTEYEAAASLLCALDVMVGDGTNFNPDDNITRAEFAQIMMTSMALNSAAEAYEPEGMFDDVPTGNIFAPAIELGVGIGAIQGYGDGNFGPDDDVLGEQAVKMMTFAAGHNVTAVEKGGYPAGYIANAREIGMLKGISDIDFTIPMTRGQAAVLCANTLKVDMMKKITSGGKVTYETKEGVNLLSEKHDVYKADGIVTANAVTSLWQTSDLRDGFVRIGSNANSVYAVGETTISDAFGKYVRAYYKVDKEADVSTVVSYEILDSKNGIITTDLANVEYGTVTNTELEYWVDKENDNRPEKIKIVSGSPSIIYNGVARTSMTVAATFAQLDTDGKSGEVTFLDNDGDGTYDVISIKAYDTVYVNRINAIEYKLSDKLTNKVYTIDVANNKVFTTIVDIDGEALEFDDISTGDVLSIAESDPTATRQSVEVIASTESVDGKVTATSVTNNGMLKLSIDGVSYELTKQYFNYITDGNGLAQPENSRRVRLGDSGEFYLDAFGKIAYHEMEGASGDAEFGMMRQYARGTGADVSVKIRMYTGGEYIDYSVASRVEIDGTSVKGEDAIMAALGSTVSAYETQSFKYYTSLSGVVPMLFVLDKDDKIVMIDTPIKGTSESDYSLQPVRGSALDARRDYEYTKSTQMLGSLVKATGATVLIQIPEDVAQIDNLRKLSTSTASNWADEKVIKNMQCFTTEPNSAELLYAVSQSPSQAASLDPASTGMEEHDKQILVVSETVEFISEDGTRTIRVIGLQEGVEKEITVDPDYYSTDMARDVWAFNKASTPSGIGQFQDYETDALAKRSPLRTANSPLLPGDAIRYQINDAEEMTYVEPTFLIDCQLFRTDNAGTYRGIDMALVQEIEDNTMYLKYIINTANGANANATAMIETNADGYVISSKNTAGANYTFYDDVAGVYLSDMTADGMADMSSYKIMVYDASRPVGSRVYVGSTFDLYDSKDALSSEPASLIIMQHRSNRPRGMYIIKY